MEHKFITGDLVSYNGEKYYYESYGISFGRLYKNFENIGCPTRSFEFGTTKIGNIKVNNICINFHNSDLILLSRKENKEFIPNKGDLVFYKKRLYKFCDDCIVDGNDHIVERIQDLEEELKPGPIEIPNIIDLYNEIISITERLNIISKK